MTDRRRALAFVLAAALLLPGLVVGLAVCPMLECPAMTAAGHDCCPPDGAEIAAACCRQSFEASTPPSNPPERFGALDVAAGLGPVLALPVPAPVFEARVLAAKPPRPLDSLALTCLLRI
ncbi:MAG: hypothetical protein SF066_18505 [Thermoanaerobaculia bacterium]|nr:hypothetical protein [Thermoanaerobaculia bacterium]